MAYVYNDGGRADAGYKGSAGDCGARAMAIALDLFYKQAYDALADANKEAGRPRSARNGISKDVYSKVLERNGWVWHSAPKFVGRKAYASDMPEGTVIARMAGHFVCIIDGVIQDTFDCSHKMVYGFWAKPSDKTEFNHDAFDALVSKVPGLHIDTTPVLYKTMYSVVYQGNSLSFHNDLLGINTWIEYHNLMGQRMLEQKVKDCHQSVVNNLDTPRTAQYWSGFAAFYVSLHGAVVEQAQLGEVA